MDNAKIFCGTSNVPLAKAVCEYLNVPLGQAELRRFSDGEIFAEISESVRGSHVFVIQSTCPPVNEHIMELLIITDALKRASARAITAVIPYYGYARQDRKVQPRAPISAKLVADLVTTAGISRVVTVDVHAGQIQGFFNIPVDHIFAAPIFIQHIKEKYAGEDIVIVSPDAGGMERARSYAKMLDAALAMTDKRRPNPNVAEIMNVIGDVEGKTAILVDDLVDTAGTAIQAGKAILREGAKRVSLCSTHGVLSGNAIQRITESSLEEIILTDTIPQTQHAADCDKIRVISIANLLGEAIKRIATGESISSLFN
ncbi:MAG TPA: ribose-phosphate pyrophosphokinase [Thermodesulfobacteriota bacterium]|nr:ribose-phosphate pyrophosphokinase [Thermodesulfobacteriota bacterium]